MASNFMEAHHETSIRYAKERIIAFLLGKTNVPLYGEAILYLNFSPQVKARASLATQGGTSGAGHQHWVDNVCFDLSRQCLTHWLALEEQHA